MAIKRGRCFSRLARTDERGEKGLVSGVVEDEQSLYLLVSVAYVRRGIAVGAKMPFVDFGLDEEEI